MPGVMATKLPLVREELRSRSLTILDKQEWLCGSTNQILEHDEQTKSIEGSASCITLHGRSHGAVALVALLKASTKQKDISQGNRLHAVIVKQGLLLGNIIVGNSLINLYAKCGELETALNILCELPIRDVVSWTTVIARLCELDHGEEALHCFDCMKLEGLSPDPTILASILRACGNTRDIERGKGIHAEIVREGWLKGDIVLGSALMDMYAKCGKLGKAQQMFNELSAQDLVSWNSLIAGYAQYRYGDEALSCFQQSLLEGLPPNSVTFTCVLKACSITGAREEGKRLHAVITGMGLSKEDTVLGSALVDMYAKCGVFAQAQRVFDKLPSRNGVCWTGLITGLCQHMRCEEALAFYDLMILDGLFPDGVTYACIFKACGNIGAVEKGKELHGEILRRSLLGKDTVLGNALLDMYCKFGALRNAREVFENLPSHNLVTWNSLISGYSQHGHDKEALVSFRQLQSSGLLPDTVTFTCVLKACGSIGAVDKGSEVHVEVIRRGLLENGVVLGNALVDMYAKCGWLPMAHQVFNELFVRDVVSWNALITAYCDHGFGEQGLHLLEYMRGEGLHPNAVTFTCFLKACGIIEAACQGEEIHHEIIKKGLLENMNVLGNALLSMYMKCGELHKAQQLFEELPARDVVSWNVLLSACCKYGHCKEALKLYERMNCDSVSPDVVTLACLLQACIILGAAEKGQQLFFEIITKGLLESCIMFLYGLMSMCAKSNLPTRAHVNDSIGAAEKGEMVFESFLSCHDKVPIIEHNACMMKLVCREGCLQEATKAAKKQPELCHLLEGFCVIGFAQKSGTIDVGRLAFEKLYVNWQPLVLELLGLELVTLCAGMKQLWVSSQASKHLLWHVVDIRLTASTMVLA